MLYPDQIPSSAAWHELLSLVARLVRRPKSPEES
jgi:hypothetical protein